MQPVQFALLTAGFQPASLKIQIRDIQTRPVCFALKVANPLTRPKVDCCYGCVMAICQLAIRFITLAKEKYMNIKDVELMRELQRRYYRELENSRIIGKNECKKGVHVNPQVLFLYRLLSTLALTFIFLIFINHQ